ncbi:MAG: hypothetical protein DHS20C05_20330 [Hyphococcus sp.]|nr:MAG: hypothetical protein DHS20C05_20330 [Marinicaulis sp.]
MKFTTGKEFLEWPQRAVTIIGMSGVGKTWLSAMLRRHGWFHYSVDYRIGTRYLGEHIADNFKREAMKSPLLRNMLMSDSISIASNLRFEDLSPLSTYLGAPGAADKGGLSFAEFKKRQALHRDAEINATRDIGAFIDKAHDIYGYDHFVCDASGSVCEVVDPNDEDDPVLTRLAEKSLILYIRESDDHAKTLIKRFRQSPKPMYYNPSFLDKKWTEFLQEKNYQDETSVDPDEFAVWGFGELIKKRQPAYKAIGENWGYSVDAAELAAVEDAQGFVRRVADIIDRA